MLKALQKKHLIIRNCTNATYPHNQMNNLTWRMVTCFSGRNRNVPRQEGKHLMGTIQGKKQNLMIFWLLHCCHFKPPSWSFKAHFLKLCVTEKAAKVQQIHFQSADNLTPLFKAIKQFSAFVNQQAEAWRSF